MHTGMGSHVVNSMGLVVKFIFSNSAKCYWSFDFKSQS